MSGREITNFYKQSKSRQKNNVGNYYIHLHAENIGRLFGGDINDAARLFNVHRTYAYKTMRQEVLKSWRKTITPVNNKITSVLNTVFSQDLDGYVTEIDKTIRGKIEDNISNAAEKVIDIQKKASNQNFALILNKGKSREAIEELNKTVEIIAEAVKLLKSPMSNSLAIALLNAQNNSPKTITGYSRNLLKALNNFKKVNQIAEESDIDLALKTLTTLCKNINEQKTRKGENLTAKSLKNTVDYVFTSGLTESIVANSLVNANNEFEKMLISTCGQTNGTLEFDEKFQDNSKIATGKTDVNLKNVKITLENFLRGAELITEVGLSVKSYRVTNFLKNGKALPKTISSGRGGNLQTAFKAIFGDNEMGNYYAYNTIAFRTNNQVDEASLALNDLIIARRFNRLFMQRNKRDFSQILVVNGQVFSFWEIIKSIAEAGSARFSSSKNINQIVSLSIPDTKTIKNINQRIENANIIGGIREDGSEWAAIPWARSKRVLQVINKATVSAKIHLDNYYRLLNKNL